MKLRILILVTPLFLAGQSTDVPTGVRLTPAANVPATVLDRFRLDFPKATPAWQQSGDEWSAAFSDDSTQLPRVAVYDKAGRIVEGRKQLEKGGYPQGIDQYFHTHYPTDQYKVWRHDKRDEPANWYVIRGADTTWFREDGSYAYNLNVRRPKPLVTNQEAEVIQSLWSLNQMRLAILKVADKNGFVTTTRQQQADKMDEALRSLASSMQVELSYNQDEKDDARLSALSKLHGEELTRSVNRELQKNSAQINRQLQKAGRSDVEQVRSFAGQFGGPE